MYLSECGSSSEDVFATPKFSILYLSLVAMYEPYTQIYLSHSGSAFTGYVCELECFND